MWWKWILLLVELILVLWIFERFIKWIKRKEQKGKNDP